MSTSRIFNKQLFTRISTFKIIGKKYQQQLNRNVLNVYQLNRKERMSTPK